MAERKSPQSKDEMEETEFTGDPVEVIKGVLKGVNGSSVELQHLAKNLWYGHDQHP